MKITENHGHHEIPWNTLMQSLLLGWLFGLLVPYFFVIVKFHAEVVF